MRSLPAALYRKVIALPGGGLGAAAPHFCFLTCGLSGEVFNMQQRAVDYFEPAFASVESEEQVRAAQEDGLGALAFA